VLTEAEITEEFAEALEARDLPEKAFYWLPPSPRAWRTLTRDPYFAELNRSWKNAAGKLAGAPPSKTTLVSLGAGDGYKDLMLMNALGEAGCEIGYVAVDSSQTLLETACAAAEDADIPVTGIKADISALPHLVYSADAAASEKLFIMSGCTLGALDPLVEIKYIAQIMRAGERLLIDAELLAEDTVTRRNYPAVRAYACAPLAAIGISPDSGDLRFEQKRDDHHEGLYLVTRNFHARSDLHANFCAKEVLIQKGERIALNFQYVFTPESFHWLLTEHAGLEVTDTCAEGRYVTAVCRK